MECKYCDRVAKNNNSNKQHEIRCSLNPDKIRTSLGMSGKKGTNHFMKAAESGSPIPRMSKETKEKIRNFNLGRKASIKTRKKLSESRKRFLNLNPDKVPYVLNHSSNQSYPEKYFMECFLNVKNIKSQYRVKRYSLDFANPLTKRYVEIDGEQHYVDSRIVNHDKRRTICLYQLGWDVKRVRWKHFNNLTYDKKLLIVNDLIRFIQ